VSDNVLIAAVVRVVSWLYSIPNPQAETYFRDLRGVEDVEREEVPEYFYKADRDVAVVPTPAISAPPSSIRLTP